MMFLADVCPIEPWSGGVRAAAGWVASASWQASLVVALVLLAQWALGRQVSARWRYGLWALVLARLLLPAVPGSRYSPFNWGRVVGESLQRRQAPEGRDVPSTATEVAVAARGEPYRAQSSAAAPHVSPSAGALSSDSGAAPEGAPGPAAPQSKAESPATLAIDAAREQTRSPMRPVPVATVPAGKDPAAVLPGAGVMPSGDPPAGAVASAVAFERAKASTPPDVTREMLAPPGPTHSPVPAAIAPARGPFRLVACWPCVLAWGWLAGAAALASRVAWASARLARRVARLPAVDDLGVLALFGECCGRLNVRRRPRLRLAPDDLGPALVGVFRPCVLLPRGVLRAFGRDELEMILLHELTHLKRRDVAVNWLLSVIHVLHWFNPALWFALARMRADRELACDEAVLRAVGGGRGDAARAYGPAILELLEIISGPRGGLARVSPAGGGVGMVGVLDGKSYLRRRIAMIAQFDPADPKVGRWSLPGLALSLIVGGVALTGAVRGDEPGEPAPVADASPAADPGVNAPPAPAEPESPPPPPEPPPAPPEAHAVDPLAPPGVSAPPRAEPQPPSSDGAADPFAAAPGAEDPLYVDAARKVDDLEAALAEAGESLGQEHPKIKSIRRDLDRELDRLHGQPPNRRHAPAARPVRPDDAVRISFVGEDGKIHTAHDVRVDGGGELHLPYARPVRAAGMTEAQLRGAITDAYGASAQMPAPRVTVQVRPARRAAPATASNPPRPPQPVHPARPNYPGPGFAPVTAPRGPRAFPAQPIGPAAGLPAAPPMARPPAIVPPGAVHAPVWPPHGVAPFVTPAPGTVPAAAPPVSLPPSAGVEPVPAVPPTPPAVPPTPAAAPRPAPVAPAPGVPAPIPMPRPRGMPDYDVEIQQLRAELAQARAELRALRSQLDGRDAQRQPRGGPNADPRHQPRSAPHGGRQPGAVAPPASRYLDRVTAKVGGLAPDEQSLWQEYEPKVWELNHQPQNLDEVIGAFQTARANRNGGANAAVAGPRPPALLARIEDPAGQRADAQVAERLRKNLPEVQFEAVPLAGALDFLRDAAEVNVFIDSRALEAAGVDRNAPVTVRLRDVSAERALEMILHSADEGALGFALDRGVVVVSTKEQLDKIVLTRTYDVGELLKQGGPSLTHVIQATVSPDHWRENGGSVGTIVTFGNKVVVTTTEPDHREVEKLLEMLRSGELPAPAERTAPAGQPQPTPTGPTPSAIR